MAGFKRLISMERTDDEKMEARVASYSPSIADMPDVPAGLCICLTESELEKLDLDDDCEIGDMLHMMCMAKVTSISKQDSGSGAKIRIEMSIVMMSVEDESTEGTGE